MELHFDAAVLVAEYLLALRTNYRCSLDSSNQRSACHSAGTEWQGSRYAIETVFVGECRRLAAAVVAVKMGIVLDASENVLAVGIEMPFQRELVSGYELAAIACPGDFQTSSCLFFHAHFHSSLAVRKDVLQFLSLCRAISIDPVETLSITARIVVDLQLIIAGNT